MNPLEPQSPQQCLLGDTALPWIPAYFFVLNDTSWVPVWKSNRDRTQSQDLKVSNKDSNLWNLHGQKGIKTVVAGGNTQIQQDLNLSLEAKVGDSTFLGFYLVDRDLPVTGDGSSTTLSQLEQLRLELRGPWGHLATGELKGELWQEDPWAWSQEALALDGFWKANLNWQIGSFYGQSNTDALNIVVNLQEGVLGAYPITQQGQVIQLQSETVFLEGELLRRGEDYLVDYGAGSITLQSNRLPKGGQRLFISFRLQNNNQLNSMSMTTLNYHLGGLSLTTQVGTLQNHNDASGSSQLQDGLGTDMKYENQWLKLQYAEHLVQRDSATLNSTGYRSKYLGEIKILPDFHVDYFGDRRDRDYRPWTHNIFDWNFAQDWALGHQLDPAASQFQQGIQWLWGDSSKQAILYKMEILQGDTWSKQAVEGSYWWANSLLRLQIIDRQLWDNQIWQAQRSQLTFGKISGVWKPEILFKYWDQDEIPDSVHLWRKRWETTLGGSWWKDSTKEWLNTMEWSRVADSSRTLGLGEKMIWNPYPQNSHSFDFKARWTRLDGSDEWTWVGLGDVKSEANWAGRLYWSQHHQWNITEEQPMRKVYQKVASGTGDVIYDSIQGRYIENTEGGDYRFWGYARDTTVPAHRSHQSQATWNVHANFGQLLGVKEGFLADLDASVDLNWTAMDSATEILIWPDWIGAVRPSVYELNRIWLPKIEWKPGNYLLTVSDKEQMQRWENDSKGTQDESVLDLGLSWRLEPWNWHLAWEQSTVSWAQNGWSGNQEGIGLGMFRNQKWSLNGDFMWRSAQGIYGSSSFDAQIPIVSAILILGPPQGLNWTSDVSWRWMDQSSLLWPYQISEGFGPGQGWRFSNTIKGRWDWGLELQLGHVLRYEDHHFWQQWNIEGRGYF